MFKMLGAMVVAPLDPVTVKVTALLRMPVCWTCAIPLIALAATVATIWVSLHVTTTPAVLPSWTLPVPCIAPKLDPAMVTTVPGEPLSGKTLVMVRVLTVKGCEFDQTPLCSTLTVPVREVGAIVATIWTSSPATPRAPTGTAARSARRAGSIRPRARSPPGAERW